MEHNPGSPLGQVIATTSAAATCRFDRSVLYKSRERSGEANPMTSIGGLCKIWVGETLLLGVLTELAADSSDEGAVLAKLEYIGEGQANLSGTASTFRRGVSVYPHPGDAVWFAETADYEQVFAPPELAHIEIGTVYPSDSVRAPILFDLFLGRHFAVVGSSGTGKSTSVALLLQRIIDVAPHGHIVVLDPHGEYARAFGKQAKVWDVTNLRLPYWAMNLEEHCESFIPRDETLGIVDSNIIAKCLERARTRNLLLGAPKRVTADSPVPYQFEHLISILEEEAGRLEKIAETQRYTQIRLTLEQFFRDERFSFIFNPELWDASLEELLADIIGLPASGQPISIINLAGVPTEIVNVVVSILSRLILDFAIRSARIRSLPVMLVCEEAHRYLPRVSNSATASVERQLERIAREGRKYGVCLGIVSQRPSELSDTALSQCGTIISHRLNNDDDRAQVHAAMPEGGKAYVGAIGSLKDHECIICGEGVPVPMRVMIDEVAPEHRPASEDPVFSEAWQHEGGEAELLTQVVRAWSERS